MRSNGLFPGGSSNEYYGFSESGTRIHFYLNVDESNPNNTRLISYFSKIIE